MNSNERLMVTAMEEAAEIQQDISKALRFGVNNHHPDKPEETNGFNIMKEFHQLRAVMDMLNMSGIISDISEEMKSQVYRDKISAVEKWDQTSETIEQESKWIRIEERLPSCAQAVYISVNNKDRNDVLKAYYKDGEFYVEPGLSLNVTKMTEAWQPRTIPEPYRGEK